MNILNTINNFAENQGTTVAGRVVMVRKLSKKLSFIVLEDFEGQIQVGIRSENVPARFDVVIAKGLMKLSQTGEKTVWDENPQIIAKNEGELPNFKGISDGNLVAQKRYLDILTNKNLKSNLIYRSNVIKSLRQFLWSKGFIEIETPVLCDVPSGASATPFVTKHEALNKDFYLRIATEIPLKKAVVAGCEKVFEIGKIFRNEGIDKTHNPEFTSIELYWAYQSLDGMKNLLVEFLQTLGCDFNYHHCEFDEIVQKFGPNFDKNLTSPTFVYGQPLEETPLCAARSDGKADRFEFFVNGFEVANAYQELRFWEEQSKRLGGQGDDGLVEALKYGCPPLAGMGIGIDRLVMALKNIEDIADVIFFPSKRNA